MSQNEVVGGLPDGKSEDQSFFLKEMIAELTAAEKCREYTIARLREFPRKTNRRDFRRANADRCTSVKSVVAAKKNLIYVAADPSPTPEFGPIRMPLKVTAVDSPTNLAKERHWAMIRALGNPARDERQSRFRTYLALNWQRRRIKTTFKWIEQRFPTPPQPGNNGDIDGLVTTNHLLRPNEQRRAASLLPIWLPNPTVPALNCPRLLPHPGFRKWIPGLHQKLRLTTPCQSETKTKNTRDSQMKQHDSFDSIADLIYRQGVFLEILIHRLATVEATVLVLALHTVPEDTLGTIKAVEDEILSKIHGRLAAEVEHNVDDS